MKSTQMLCSNLAEAESGPESWNIWQCRFCFGHQLLLKARVSDKPKVRVKKITIATGPKKPFVMPVARCLWNCSVRDGAGLTHCWKSSALCAHLGVNGKSGEAHLCYVQSPFDIKHHPSVRSSLNRRHVAQNHRPRFSLSTASELPSLGRTHWHPSSLLYTMCLSSPSPMASWKLRRCQKKKIKIYGRAAWKLLVFPIPHD